MSSDSPDLANESARPMTFGDDAEATVILRTKGSGA